MVERPFEPVEPALGDHDGERGVTVERATEHHAVEHELDRLVALRDAELSQQHHVARGVRPRGVEAGRLVPDVEQGDHAEVGRGRPDRVEPRVHDRHTGDGDGADEECPAPAFSHPRELDDRRVDVAEVEAGDREEPVRVAVDGIGEPRVARVDDFARQCPIVEEAGIEHPLETDHGLEVDAVGVEPVDPHAGVGRAVHRRSLVAVVVGLLLGSGDGGDARGQELLPRRPLGAGDVAEDVAGHDPGRDLGGVEGREAVAQGRVVVEPDRPGLEVRIDVDDGHGCSRDPLSNRLQAGTGTRQSGLGG